MLGYHIRGLKSDVLIAQVQETNPALYLYIYRPVKTCTCRLGIS